MTESKGKKKMDMLTAKYWESIHDGSGNSPFKEMPITEESVFVRLSLCAPMPCCAGYSNWDWAPSVQAMSAFLRYRAMISDFQIWLAHEEWDAEAEEFILAEDLFKKAQESGECRYVEDIPLMETIVQHLDQSMQSHDRESALLPLQMATKAFNDKWENTRTWNFSFHIYPSFREVQEAIIERFAEQGEDVDRELNRHFDMNKSEWDQLWSSPFSDDASRDKITAILEKDCDC